MKTQLNLTGDSKTLDALSRFLSALEAMQPESVTQPKAICSEDNVIYVEVGYRSEEDSFLVGDHMAEISAQIVEEMYILVALAPFVVEGTDGVKDMVCPRHMIPEYSHFWMGCSLRV